MEELEKLNYNVDSVKINFNENVESRRYGFIYFSKKKDALKFIQTKPNIGQTPIEGRLFEKRLLKGRTRILFTKGYPHKENELDLLLQHARVRGKN